MILFLDETGHFTCSQKRTFSLATDTSELAVTRPELRLPFIFPTKKDQESLRCDERPLRCGVNRHNLSAARVQ
jgi:hypothetical protein